MPLAAPILQTTLAAPRPDRQGKVRDIYDFGDRLLIVATDRISAFDYVLGSGIPDKGKVLTQISAFWFERTRDDRRRTICSSTDVGRLSGRGARPTPSMLAGRSMLVREDRAAADRVRRARLPVGIGLEGLRRDRAGLRHRAARRACANRTGCRAPIFTPATKAAERPRHQHQRARGGRARRAERCSRASRDLTLRLYAEGAAHAESRGIIVADTKFEFGLLPADGATADADRLILIDEVLTPDSSRFWPRDALPPGRAAAELRQAVRPRLPRSRSSGTSSRRCPSLPDDVVAKTREKYLEAFRRLTGRELWT